MFTIILKRIYDEKFKEDVSEILTWLFIKLVDYILDFINLLN